MSGLGVRVTDDLEPVVESDLRRRAAWLLGMLAIVAVLFVVLMSSFVNGDDNGSADNNSGPLDNSITGAHSNSASRTADPGKTSASRSATATSSSPASASRPACPTTARCALDSDVGNAVAAVNAYRTAHGRPALPGTVSEAAKACALSNGTGCSGGWAETPVPSTNGTVAVNKIVQFAKLLDPNMTSFGVGWAYDPAGKQLFFAIVRNG